MEFHVRFENDLPELEAVEHMLRELDPSAVVDLDPSGGLLRVSTWLEARQLSDTFARVGHAVQLAQIVALPSVCCGSCSG